MKRVLLSLGFLFFIALNSINAQVVVTGADAVTNAASPFATLGAAFTSINGNGQAGNNIVITITGNTAEPGTAVLNAGAWTTITISPGGGATQTISGTVAGAPLIDLNGADNVTIDGLNTGGNVLVITNLSTSSTSGTSTIRLVNDAANNIVTNCSIFGSGTTNFGTLGGTIFFGASAGGAGNDNNTISNNLIGPAGVNLPSKGIFAQGTSAAAQRNSGINISNNHIFDFHATATSAGINLEQGNTDWTINANRLFQTAPRAVSGGIHSGIRFASTDINNCVVSNNVIGFATGAGTGIYTFVGTTALTKFVPININNHGSVTSTSITGNTITGIATSGTMSGAGLNAPFIGILVANGLVSVTNNTIGSLTTSGSIFCNSTSATNADYMGVFYNTNAGTPNISGNNIGGITVNNTNGAPARASLYGIFYTSTAANSNIQANLIGGTAVPSMQSLSINNTTLVQGIFVSGGSTTITNNIIGSLSSNAISGAGAGIDNSPSIGGIVVNATGNTHTITGNTIGASGSLVGTSTGHVTGIMLNGNNGANIVEGNFIHSLVASSGTAAIIGINAFGGTATYQNNMVRLGIDPTGASITNGVPMTGINENAGTTTNFFHNSVYIGGSGVVGAVNTFAFGSIAITNTHNYRNNIFFNARSNGGGTGTHYAIRLVPGGTLNSNHNILFANGTGGVLGLFNGTNQSTITAWRTASSQDANSKSCDPSFLNPTGTGLTVDLHLTGTTPAEAAGFNVGVVNDFDGTARAGFTPVDIGADAGNFTASEEIDVVGNSVSIMDGDITPAIGDHTDFGNSVSNCNTVVRTFTINNTGAVDLTVSSIVVSGADAGMFTLGALTPASPVGGAGTATFTVTFTPTSNGLKTAAITINNSDCDESIFDFAIQGTGISDITDPSISGTITDATVEGCVAGDAPAAETTVLDLETNLGIAISDDCTPDASLTVSHVDVPVGTCPIVVTRTYTITDAAGNSSTIDHIINVDDTTDPSITGTITTSTVEGCVAGDAPAAETTVAGIEALTGAPSISDVCTVDGSLVVTSNDVSSGTCPIVVTRTYTITDACGNASTIDHIINVDDTTPPTITGTITTSTVEGCVAGDAPAAETTVAGIEALTGAPSISDVCTVDGSLVVTSNDVSSGTCPIVVTRTYTITDACGNASTIDHIINVDDTTPPTITGTITTSTVEGCVAGDAPAAETTVAGIEALTGAPSISDVCTVDGSLVVTSNDVSAGTCPIVVTRTYTITDACGNASTIDHIINVDDTTPPTITGTITTSTVEGCVAGDAPAAETTVAGIEALTGAPSISDVCTVDGSLVVTSNDVSSGTCPIVVTRTYTITDACGNASTIDHIINVDDTTPPTITGTITTSTVEGCVAGDAPAAETTVAGIEALTGAPSISDVCTVDGSLVVTSNDVSSGTCPIVVTRTYTITDACGNASTIDHIINVDDTTPPAITGTITTTTVEGCSVVAAPAAETTVAGIEALTGAPSISDVCTVDGSLVVTSNDVSSGTCPIVVTRTYTITDACGNASTIDHIINVDDTTPPTITGTITTSTVEGCVAGDAPAAETTVAGIEALTGAPSISDVCTVDGSLVVTSNDVSSGTCPIVVTRTYTITDACGNASTIDHIINVDDTTPPTITGTITTSTVEGCVAGDAPAAETTVAGIEALTGAPSISDVCTVDGSLVVTSNDVSSGTCPIVVTRTYTITDACGNASTIDHIINVDDTTPPTITGTITTSTVEGCVAGDAPAAETTVAGIEALTGAPSISDVCTVDGSLVVTSNDVSSGTCPIVVTRTYTITDACGNASTIDHIINVDDTTPPTITGTITTSTVEGCVAGDAPAAETTVAGIEALTGAPSISDVCTVDGSLVVTSNDVSSGTCPIVVTRTYTITDACGNASTIDHIINVDDTTPPTITGTITTSTVEGCVAGDAPAAETTVAGIEALTGAPSISDVCTVDGSLVVTSNDVSSGTCPIVVTRTYTITDACGNASTIDHIINVDDTTPPTITGTITTSTVEGCVAGDAPVAETTVAGIEALTGTPSISDACTNDASLVVTSNDVSVGTCPIVITRTYTITDACNNSSTIDHIINVDDTTDPTASNPAPINVQCIANVPAPDVNEVTDEADNCLAPITVTFVSDVNNGGTGCTASPYVVTRTYNVADACGNNINVTQTITSIDNTSPTISCAANVTAPSDLDSCGASLTITGPTSIDNCSAVTIVNDYNGTSDASDYYPVGTTIVTWTSTDACGNTNTCTQSITVNDVQPPVAICQNYTAVLDATGNITISPVDVDGGSFDNCTSGLSMFVSPNTFTCANVGTNSVVLSVSDGVDTATCNAFVTVVDLTPPVTICQNLTVALDATGNVVVFATQVDNGSNDACGIDFVAFDSIGIFQVPFVQYTCANLGPNTVTLQAYDVNGNTGSCLATITVIDTLDPIVTCPADITADTDPGQCSATFGVACPPVSGFNGPYDVSNWTQTLTNSDGSVNTSGAPGSIVITSGNNLSSNPGETDFSLNAPFTCNATITFDWSYTTTDGAGFDYPRYSLDGGSTFILFPGYSNVGANNQSGTETISVPTGSTLVLNMETNDNLNGAANLNIFNFNVASGPIFSLGTPVTSDNCTVTSITNDAPGTFPIDTTVVTWTVTDQSGNTTTCTQNVIVEDNENPVIVCAADVTTNTDAGVCTATVTLIAPSTTDNCGIDTVFNNHPSTTYTSGTTPVTWVTIDLYGNTDTCIQNVIVIDNEIPTITCPADINQDADPGICAAVVSIGTATVNDNCGVLSTTNNGLGTYPVGTTFVTWIVTDVNGNSNSCIQTITINDVEDPIITCPANIVVNNAIDTCGAVVTYPALIVTDNCGAGYDLNSCSSTPVVQTTPTNIITGDDTTATIPVGFPFEFNGNPVTNITVSTNGFISMDANNGPGCCNGDPLPTVSYPNQVNLMWFDIQSSVNYSVEGTAPNRMMVFDYAGIEYGTGNPAEGQIILHETTNEIQLLLSNVNGVAHFGTQGININGTTAYPVPTRNSVTPFTFTNDCQSFMPSEIDTFLVAGLTSGSIFPVGVTTVTYAAVDAVGNSDTCSFTVTVNDVQVPVIACQADTTVNNDPGFCSAVVSGIAPDSFGDNCPNDTVTYIIVGATTASGMNDASGTTFNLGTSTVTYYIEDASNNIDSCSFDVTVVDNELPTLTCQADTTTINDFGFCGAVVNGISLEAFADNCPGAVVTYSITGVTTASGNNDASGNFFNIGASTVTYVITDGSGNMDSCAFVVTVLETEPPVITCPLPITDFNDPGICGAVVIFPPATATDNCTVTVTQIGGAVSGSIFPVGVSTITYLATDGAGNTDTCSFTITIIDNELPIVTCPPNATLNAVTGACEQTHSWTTPIPTDNCGIASMTLATSNPSVNVITTGPTQFALFPVGTTTLTYTVTDINGNTNTCSFDVTIVDDQDPIITGCPTDFSVNNDPGVCGAIVTWAQPISSDNCPGDTLVSSPLFGTLFPIGATTVTYTATDASGNTTTCSFVVTVIDTEAPAIVCPSNITVTNDPGICGAIVTYTAPTGTDNCPGATTNQTDASGLTSGSTFPVGTTTQTFTVTDGNGLTSSCSFTITVTDDEAPIIACPANITDTNDVGICGAVITYTAPVGTDNCLGAVTVQTSGLASGATYPVGVTTNTFMTTDAAGNTTSCSFTVTITDTEDPTVVCPVAQTLNLDGACSAVLPNYILLSTSNDNCGVAGVTQNPLPGTTVSGTGLQVVTLTVTDIYGNTSTCSFNVTKTDITPPTIVCSANQTQSNDLGSCDANVTVVGPTANDNCGPITVINSFNGTNDASGVYPVGTTVVTWTATDGAGLTNTCTQTITVTDNEAPAIVCPANIADTTDAGICGAVITYTAPVGTDNCLGAVTVQTSGLASGATYPVGVTTNTFMTTDAAGNTTTCSFTVTITDNEDPTITCPGAQNLDLDAGCNAILPNYTALATTGDNCGVMSVTQSPAGGTTVSGTGVTIVTLTVTDVNGNTSTCSFNVTRTDVTAPTIVCAANQTQSNDLGSCDANVTVVGPTFNDNCGPVIVTNSFTGTNDASGVYPVGTTVVTWTATDGAGLTAICVQTITVTDNEAPAIACPANITDTTDAGICGAVITYTAPVGTDNCLGAVTVQTSGLASGATYPVGVTTNTFMTTDAAGNTTTCSFTVTITDNEDPTITCPAAQNLDLDAGCNAILPNYTALATTSDNCGVMSVTQSPAGGTTVSGTGVTIVTLTVTDVNGNTSTCSFNVTRTDVTAPTIVCAANQTQSNDLGSCDANVTVNGPTFNDNCGPITVTNSFNGTNDASGVYPVGTTVVTWTATDGAGLTAICVQTITVTDNEAPAIVCPANIADTTDAGICGAVITYTAPVGTDNCLGAVTVQTSGLASGATYPVGVTTNTFMTTDAAGNTTTCSFTVTITDNEDPTITCPAAQNLDLDAGCNAILPNYTALATTSDNCGVMSVTQSPAGGTTVSGTGVTIVTLTVTDVNGNTSTCSFNVTRTDVTAPTIVCAANQTQSNDLGSCDANVTVNGPTFNDNCGPITVTNSFNGTNDASGVYPVGTTVVTWTATDGAGLTAICVQTITVTDNEAPAIVCPANIADTTDAGICGAVITYTAPVGTDNCLGAVTVQTSGLASGATYPVGVTTNTFMTTDAAGNTTTCSFTVTITDNEDPTIVCPGTQNLNLDGACSVVIPNYTALATTADNCGVASTTQSPAPGTTLFGTGTQVVTLTVTDVNGNTSTCTFNVTKTDITVPVIVCAPNQTQSNDLGSCDANVTVVSPIATDNCGPITLTNSVNGTNDASGVYPVGTTTIIWTATDGAGLTATCTQTITVNDTELPAIVCPVVAPVSNDPGVCGAVVTFIAPIGTDNCAGATTVQTAGLPSGSTFPVGNTINTFVVTDASGNTTSCSFTVTVNDTEAPVTSCADITVFTSPGQCGRSVNYLVPFTDNCPGATVIQTDGTGYTSGNFFPVGTTPQAYLITDASGNTATCTFNVIVIDNEVPQVACPSNISVTNATGLCGENINMVQPVYSDNCNILSVLNNFNGTSDGSGFYPVGTTTVVWTVTDVNGNTNTCSMTVTVTDVEAPTIACAPDQTQTADAGVCNANVTVVPPTVNDNCGVATVVNDYTFTSDASGNYPVGTTTVIWTVTDIHGNTNTCTQLITVTDDELPVISCAPDQTQNNDPGVCGANVTVLPATATDNCTVLSITNDFNGTADASGLYPVGTTTVIWTATDVNGNTSTCTQLITVLDVEAPVASIPVLPVIVGQCNATVTTPTANDNCDGIVFATTSDPTAYNTQGTFTITWTYTDVAGNTSTQSQTVIIDDTTDAVPTVAVLPTLTGECSVTATAPTALDNCEGIITGTTLDPLTYTVEGTYTITWTYDDGNGNTSTQTQTVIVDDVTAPVADVATLPTVTGECSATIITTPTATDNCVGSIIGTTTDPLTYTTQGTFIVTWTYTDGNGNTSTQTQTVIVDDVTAPVANVTTLPTVTGECSVTVSTAPTATDNCVGTITGTTTDPLTYTTQGTFTITWTYTDGNGNTSTQTQTVIVDDVTAPVPNVATLPDVNAECGVIVSTIPTATDNCVGTINGTTTDPLTYTVQGTYTITWTYTDGNGNTSTQTQIVVIDDFTAPVPDVASLPTITGECSATVTTTPTATDNCVGTVVATTTFPLTYTSQGTYTIVWNYVDGNGNMSSQIQTVIVDDVTAPVADTTPLDTVFADCSATLTAPTATDNCTGAITATTFDPLTYSVQGTFTHTWIYFDGNGNTSTQTQIVVIDDNVGPVADVVSLPTITGECSATVTTPTATDNCSGSVDGTTTDPVSYTAEGTYVITWTYTDASGNTTTQTQTVIVNDVTAPVADATSLPDVTGECSATVTVVPTATDNCAGSITGTTTDPLTYTTGGTYFVTWTFDDGNGNVTTQIQTVMVTDNTAPVPDQPFLTNITGNCAVTVFTAPTATDGCGGVIVGTTSDALSYNVPGTYTITWTYDDGNGNTFTQNQTVIVNDCLGVDPSGETLTANIYPNPSNGIFTVELNSLPEGDAEIRVLDQLGQVVYVMAIQAQTQMIDLSHMRAATYYVQVLSGTNNFTKTIIITQKY